MSGELVFITLGQERVLCANRIWGISTLRSKQTVRHLQDAKQNNTYIDWSRNRPTRTLIYLDNGNIIGTYFAAKTIYRKIEIATGQNIGKQINETERKDKDDKDDFDLSAECAEYLEQEAIDDSV